MQRSGINKTICCFGMALCLSVSQLAWSDDEMSPGQAAEVAAARSGGRVLDVRQVEKQGRLMYRVKVLVNGRVRILWLDAEAGPSSRR